MKNCAMEKNGNQGCVQTSLFRAISVMLIILAGIMGSVRDVIARLPEPDVIYFGTLTGGTAGTFVKLKLDSDSSVLATSVVGGDLSYVLRVAMDTLEPRVSGTARSGEKASLYLGEQVIRTVVIPERGSMVKLSASATPANRENWDALHPGDDGSGDMNRNGISDLQDFLNGNDPAACVWTYVDESHAEASVYHAKVLQSCLTEAQSDGWHNLIKVATGTYFGNFTYFGGIQEGFDLRVIGGYDPAGSGQRLTTEPEKTVLVGDVDANELKNGRVFDISGGGQTASTLHIEGFRMLYGGMDWNSDVDRNAADGLHGGAVRIQTSQSDVELAGNMFNDNFAFKGGAVYIASSGAGSVLLVNNVVSNNAAFHTGGVAIDSTGTGTITLLNNTIVDNWAENEGSGDSVLIESAAAPVDLSNNIIRGVYVEGSDIALLQKGTSFPLMMRHNNYLGVSLFATDIAGFVPDASNTTLEPLFIKRQTNAFYYFPSDGNYRLLTASTGVDSGITHTLAQATDPDGRPRLVGSSVDTGAYERPVTDDSFYLNPMALTDPVVHTKLREVGSAEPMDITNMADYTFKGSVDGASAIISLTVAPEGMPRENLSLNPDNTFEYHLVLVPGENWLQFEVVRSDNAKVSIWQLITLDVVQPAVTLSTVLPDVTNTAPIPVIAVFSQEVTGFEAADIVVTNGSITPSTFSGSKADYAFTVTPAGNGTVSIDIPAGVAIDKAGNTSLAASRLSRVYDSLSPSVIISSSLPASTYITPIPFAITFSEPVTALDAASLIVSNGTISSFSGTNSGYTFNVTPAAFNVKVTVDVAAGSVFDAAGNSNAVSQLVRHYAPPIVIEPALPKTTVSLPGGYYNKTVTLTMSSTENSVIYYTLDGSTPSVSSLRYAAPLTIATTTTLRCFAVDEAGNSEQVNTIPYVIDAEPPTLTLSTLADGSATNNATLNVSGRVTDNSGIKTVLINDVVAALGGDGSFSSVITLLAGANTIVTTVVDLAENTASDTRTITQDQNAAILLVSSPADNSKSASSFCKIMGSIDKNAVIAVRINGQGGGNVTLLGNRFTGSVVLAAGINTIEIEATDPAGNVTTMKRTVTYDNQKPTLAVVEPIQDVLTSKGSILVKGSVADNLAGVTVTVDDLPVTVGTDGVFEKLIEFSEQKSYAILVKAVDEAGNVAMVQRNVIYDATAPSFTITPVLTPTNDRSQTITGTREPGAIISLNCASATVAAMTYPTPESWSVLVDNFSNGVNLISVTGVDAAGNSAVQTAGITVGNFYNGPKSISFNAPPGMTIYYTTDGTVPTTASATYSGPFTLTGTTTFRYFAVDVLGNSSQITSDVYTIDTTAPMLTVTSLSDGVTADNSVFVYNVAGTVSDNTRVKSLVINEINVPFGSDGSFRAVVTLRSGATVITAVATDIVGNRSSDTRTVIPASATVDVTAPEVAISSSPANLVKDATANIAFSSTDPGAFFECKLDSGIFAACASPKKFTQLADGLHTFTVRAKDFAGNISGDRTATWTSDTTAPAISLSMLSDNAATNTSPLNIAGAVTDANGIASLTVNGSSVAVSADGSFSHALTPPEEGDIIVTLLATDKAGNVTTDSRTIRYDTNLPDLTVTAPADNSRTRDALLAVTGTINQAVAVEIRNVTTGTSQQAVLTGTGYSGTAQLASGSNTVEVSMMNATGSVLSSIKRTVLYDPLLPALAITDPVQDARLQAVDTIIRGTVTDAAGTVVTLTFNGITYSPVVTAGRFEQAITIPAVGSFPVFATAIDTVGNYQPTVTRNIIYTPFPGDTNGDGSATKLEEVLKAFQYVAGQTNLTETEKAIFDCAPLDADGKSNPNGVVDTMDVILMLRRVVGLAN